MSRSLQHGVVRRGIAPLAALLLGACGIDQGGIDRPPDLPQLTVISGPITGFGSVHVNGLVLDPSDAQILIDGSPRAESDLRQGQVVRAIAMVESTRSRALSIEYQQSLVGPIGTLDSATGTLTVLGQSVLTNSSTRFDGAKLGRFDDLELAEPIVVSGIPTPSGTTLATYIGRAAPSDPFKITASITDVDVAALTFDLGGLGVDYSDVVLMQSPTGMPELGAVVEVTGFELVGTTLKAEQVRTLPLLPGLFDADATALTSTERPLVDVSLAPAATSSELAANFVGFITSEIPGTISLLDVDVSIGRTTIVVGGTVTDLRMGQLIRVEGRIMGIGQIVADRITIL